MFLRLCKSIPKTNFVLKRHKYIVLLPEIPEDTPDTNSLLKTDSLPQFSKLDEKTCVNAVGKLLIEYETGIFSLSEKLGDIDCKKTVESVIEPLDRLSVPLDFAWATFKILYSLQRNENMGESYLKLHQRILRAKREQFHSRSIYSAFKELNSTKLSDTAQRVVNKHLLESQLSGLGLDQAKFSQFQTIGMKLNEHKTKYRDNCLTCIEDFSKPLTTENVSDLPKEFLAEIAGDRSNPEKPPWVMTLQSSVYQPFMEFSGNRNLRRELWIAKNSQASMTSGRRLNNSAVIEEIRSCRHRLANLLGYETFADLSMKTKMAGNVDNVVSMITTLHVKSQITMSRQIHELQSFAAEFGFQPKLELWDLPYWQRLHRQHLFGNVQVDASQYFPLPKVLSGLFQLCKKLFGISIVEMKTDVWSDDVKFYQINDENGVSLAHFFVDPHGSRNSGTWMECGRNRSDIVSVRPLSYLISNFTKPGKGKTCFLTFSQMQKLFQKFGHVLQHSLTTVPYNAAAGLTNLEWDVVDVCPLFMSTWLTNYDTVKTMSSHIDSGEPITEELHRNLLSEQMHMSSLRLAEEVYLSALDLDLHTRRDFWQDIMKNLWVKFLPFPFDNSQAHVCSFPQIFCDNYPAAYFSRLWSEMIAADVYSAFQEAGFENKDALAQIGQRFRETYLSLGGGCNPGEVFRRFRGRDPSVDALLSTYGIVQQSKSKHEF